MLVSERIGQFFLESDSGRDRLEFTEYGGGDRWVVLIHGQLMPRRMHQPLAMALAAEGLHVVTVDLLGHGRSDRPADPLAYSMTAFGEQVVALLDHLGADQAVIGGTSLGANVSLEVATIAPERVRGLIAEMPVLNNALEAGILAFAPMLFAARFLPFTVGGLRLLTRPVPRGLVPFWAGIALDTMDQRAGSMAASKVGSLHAAVELRVLRDPPRDGAAAHAISESQRSQVARLRLRRLTPRRRPEPAYGPRQGPDRMGRSAADRTRTRRRPAFASTPLYRWRPRPICPPGTSRPSRPPPRPRPDRRPPHRTRHSRQPSTAAP